MRGYINFIKAYPTWLIVGMFCNVFCFITDGYAHTSGIMDNNYFTFSVLTTLILILYLMVYLEIK